MKKETHIVAYTAEDLAAMRARGEDRTDWDRVKAMTDAELEATIASDPDEAGMVVDWSQAAAYPETRIRLDPDVMAFFEAQGGDTRTTVNAVLRAHMDRVGE